MMVSLGAAIFLTTGAQWPQSPIAQETAAELVADPSRVIQGICAGIGFLGGGTILKLSDRLEVKGLTTASSIWMAAAVGTACGLTLYVVATIGTLISFIVLAVLRPIEKRFTKNLTPPQKR